MKVIKQKQYYKSGTYNVMCALCSKTVKQKDAVLDYKGLWQCKGCVDPIPLRDLPDYLPKELKIHASDLSPEPADTARIIVDHSANSDYWNHIDDNWEDITTNWEDLTRTPSLPEDEF